MSGRIYSARPTFADTRQGEGKPLLVTLPATRTYAQVCQSMLCEPGDLPILGLPLYNNRYRLKLEKAGKYPPRVLVGRRVRYRTEEVVAHVEIAKRGGYAAKIKVPKGGKRTWSEGALKRKEMRKEATRKRKAGEA